MLRQSCASPKEVQPTDGWLGQTCPWGNQPAPCPVLADSCRVYAAMMHLITLAFARLTLNTAKAAIISIHAPAHRLMARQSNKTIRCGITMNWCSSGVRELHRWRCYWFRRLDAVQHLGLICWGCPVWGAPFPGGGDPSVLDTNYPPN